MSKTIILYDSNIAGSVISAAIQLSKCPDAICHYTDSDKNIDIDQSEDTVYDMYDHPERDPLAGSIRVEAPEEGGKGKKAYRKNRSLLVFEREFPDATRPKIVHLMGAFQLSEADQERHEAIKAAIVTYLSDLSDGHVRHAWGELLANNKITLDNYLAKGASIADYLQVVGEDDRVAELEKEHAGCMRTIDQMKKAAEVHREDSARLKGDHDGLNKANKIQADILDCMDDLFFVHALTPKQVKERYKVTEMRAMCKRIELTGYSRLKEDDLIKALKKSLKDTFPAPKK